MDNLIPRGRRRRPIPEPYLRVRGGSKTYYYSIIDSDGKRRQLSTGCSTVVAAKQFIKARLLDGTLNPPPLVVLKDYAAGFFGPDAAWIKSKNKRGSRPVSEEHRAGMDSLVQNYLIPALGDRRIDAVTPRHLELMLESVLAKKSSSTAKHLYQATKTIFHQALKERLIHQDPFDLVQPVTVQYAEKGIFTPQEAQAMLHPGNWDRIHWLFNLTAAATGARMGELLALDQHSIGQDRLFIGKRLRTLSGVVEGTKTGDGREIPCPPELCAWLREFPGFTFSATGKAPLSHKSCEVAFTKACERIGIDDRKARRISFHSWRHFFNTTCLAASVPVHKVRHTMGHAQDKSMTFHYAHFTADDMAEVYQVQETILGLTRGSE